jgi:hypothetical protein
MTMATRLGRDALTGFRFFRLIVTGSAYVIGAV